MKNTPVFRGAATALVTPFTEKGIDFKSFDSLIDYQLDNSTDALVICGTTGEAPTLSDSEHIKCVRRAVKRAGGRVPVIAGSGGNDTYHACEMSKKAEAAGADALLAVTPYYNRATERGLIDSYTEIASSVSLPVILYNVPARTTVAITGKVYSELAAVENIVAVKEAGSDFSASIRLFSSFYGDFDIYCGNDERIFPFMCMGASGAISVLGNLMPKAVHDICELCQNGDWEGGRALWLSVQNIIGALFCEVNPIPVKTAMSLAGLCPGRLRLPLCEPDEEHLELIKRRLSEYGLIEE